jgi:hypothetical protein
MSVVMMNTHTYVTDNTTYIMVYVRSLNQVERNVFSLNDNEEGVGMINIENFVKRKQIQFIYRIN